MDLQSLVTGSLPEGIEEDLSLWEEREQEYVPQEALALGQTALNLFPDGDWQKPAARFALRLLGHKQAIDAPLGTQILIRILGYEEDPRTEKELCSLLEQCVQRVQTEVRTSSAEEAFGYLENTLGEEAPEIISRASGTRPQTVRNWMNGKEPAKTRLRKIYSLVLTCETVFPLLGEKQAKQWLLEPLPGWQITPLDAVAKIRYSAVPYEIRLAIRDLQHAHSQ